MEFNVRQMMVDSTGMRTDNIKPGTPITSETSSSKNTNDSSSSNVKNSSTTVEKIVPSRSRSNQRWMKLRTTVQLSSAISSTIKTSKPTLQREDSFIKRFSTRQVAEKQGQRKLDFPIELHKTYYGLLYVPTSSAHFLPYKIDLYDILHKTIYSKKHAKEMIRVLKFAQNKTSVHPK
ncbi:hypothetical protein QTP88_006143 [Uroleucon formosanum]